MNETITYETVNSYDSETRFLSEVDHLSRLRKYDGSYDSRDLSEIHENLITAVKEAAVPFAVSTTHQEYRDGSFYWIDQTPIDVAMSGYKFHNHESAIKRVDVEVEEAIDVSLNLKPGKVKIFISPRMTLSDAPYDIAKQEHLADDDQIRIHSLNIDQSGNVVGKYMQSMLIRDIPLSAWFGLLNDQNNIFSQSFNLVEDDSAITIMRTHSQLEIDEEKLPGGVLDIARATLPYMDEVSREKVENQLRLFEANQNDIHDIAETIAARWLDFEIELNESLLDGRATQTIINFIASLNGSWSEKTNDLIKNCQDNKGNLFMTRELAVELEKAKRNTLWVSAAVSAGNQEIINKVGYETASRIYENEAKISNLLGSDNLTGDQINIISNLNNSLIASHNVNIGGGCAGSTNGSFSVVEMMELFKNRRENWKWTKGVCIMGNCSYRGEVVLVGPCSICKSCQSRFDALGF
jgi:hypothetical protein